MNTFPNNADEFYLLRDNRTNLYVSSKNYQEIHCLVTVDDRCLATYTGQVTVTTVCNLLSRWCRNVTIVLPITKTHEFFISERVFLGDELLFQMQDADPFGTFTIIQNGGRDANFQIHIGANCEPIAEHCISIDSAGWFAAISSSNEIILPKTSDNNCLGGIAAACLGVAQIFKLSLNYPLEMLTADGVLDLYSLKRYTPSDELPNLSFSSDIDLGRLLMVGVGSVGSSVAFCLRALQAKCDLTIIDKDIVKVENFNRSPIFGQQFCYWNKAEAVAEYLKGSTINPKPYNGWWDDFNEKYERQNDVYDIWLPLANEFNVRWSMQNNVPPIMIHASTTQNWGVNHGRHIPNKEDCLADRFPNEVTKQSLNCSTGQVQTPDLVIDAALPFLSVFGGVFIAAELLRLQMPEYPQVANFGLIDFGGTIEQIQVIQKAARKNCVCQSQSPQIQQSLNGNSRYFYLSE